MSSTSDTPAKETRSWPRRIAKWSFVSAVTLVVLFLAFVGVMHLDFAKDIVRGRIESSLGERVNGEVHIEGLDYTLFGDLRLEGLTITDASGREALRLGAIQATPNWGSLLGKKPRAHDLTVQELVVNLHQRDDGTTNFTTLFKPRESSGGSGDRTFALDSIALSGLELHIHRDDGAVLSITDVALDGTLDMEGDVVERRIQASDLALSFKLRSSEGHEVDVDHLGFSVSGHGNWGGGGLLLEDFTARGEARFPGRESPLPIRFSLAEARLDYANRVLHSLVRDLEVGAASLDRFEATSRISFRDGALRGQQDIKLEGLRARKDYLNWLLGRELLATDIAIDGTITGPAGELVVDGEAVTDGGVLTLEGTLDLRAIEAPRYNLTLKGRRLASERLIVRKDLASIKGSFDLTVEGTGLRSDDIDSGVHLSLGKSSYGKLELDGLELDAAIQKGSFSITRLILIVLGQRYEIVGAFQAPGRTLTASLSSDNQDLNTTIEQLQTLGVQAVPLAPGAQLDLNVDVAATLRDPEAPPRAAPTGNRKLLPPAIAAQLDGLDDASIKGTIGASDLGLGETSADSVTATLDLAVDGDSLEGSVDIDVKTLLVESLALDRLGARLDLSGNTLLVNVSGASARDDLSVACDARCVLTDDGKRLDSHIERFSASFRGLDVELEERASIRFDLPPETFPRSTPVDFGPIRLRVAGGTVTLGGQVTLRRESMETPPFVEDLDVDVRLRRLRVPRLLRAMRVRLPKGVRGSLSGDVAISGSLRDPRARGSLELRLDAPELPPLNLFTSLQLGSRGLELSSTLRPRAQGSDPLLTADVELPIRFGKGKPVVRRDRLRLELTVPPLSLGRIVPFLPEGVLPERLHDASVELSALLDGRGEATFSAGIEGALMPLEGRQRVNLVGGLAPDPESGLHVLSVNVDAFDEAGQSLLSLTSGARFDRSPLRSRRFDADWELRLEAPTLDLSRLRLPDRPEGVPVTGGVGLTAELSGDRSTLTGAITLGLEAISARGRGPFDGDITVTLTPDETQLSGAIHAFGGPLLTLAGALELPGELAALKTARERPLELTVTVPERPLASLAALNPKFASMDGVLGGAFTARGTLDALTLDGAVAWRDFARLEGGPGAVALSLTADPEVVSAEIGAGSPSEPELRIRTEVPREALEAFLRKERDGLPVSLTMDADAVPLKQLLPSALPGLDALAFKGRLSSDLRVDAEMVLRGEERGPRDMRFDGALRLHDGRVRFEEARRDFHDLELVLRGAPDAILLETLSARETDPTGEVHGLDGAGRIALEGVTPTRASLELTTDRWLAIGPFDAPKGTVSAEVAVEADLTQAITPIDVAIRALDVYAPSRQRRMHYQETVGENDIVFVDDPTQVGKLPQPEEPALALGALNADVHVHMDTPQPAHFHPMKVTATLDLRASVRDGVPELSGGAKLHEGTISIMGMPYQLREGDVIFNADCLPCLDLHWRRELLPVTQRDVSLASAGVGAIDFGISGGLKKQNLDLGAAAGPYLVDGMSLQNGGRPIYTSAPQLPAAPTVQFPSTFHPQIFSFLRTNLPHLLFLDRVESWAEPNGNRGRYGEIRNFEGERYFGDGDANRLRVEAKPRLPGQNEAELQYDWLFVNQTRFIAGLGPRLGSQLRGGVEVFFEWASED